MAAKKRGERGPGKAQPVVQVRSSGGHFYIPRKVWRDMGVKDGDMLEMQRKELESGEIVYVLRAAVERDCITGSADGELVEYQGKHVSRNTIVELARMIGLLEERKDDEDYGG